MKKIVSLVVFAVVLSFAQGCTKKESAEAPAAVETPAAPTETAAPTDAAAPTPEQETKKEEAPASH